MILGVRMINEGTAKVGMISDLLDAASIQPTAHAVCLSNKFLIFNAWRCSYRRKAFIKGK